MDAFTAGHDILYLSRFSLDDQWESEKQNVKETIGFFQDRYIRDADFAAQVDAAVRRTLRLKLRLYGVDGSAADDAGEASPIAPAEALVHGSDLAVLAETSALASVTVGQVAREAFTLLYPDPASADGASAVPQTEDKILIFTDSRLVRECEECISETAVGPDELANIILRLYGPEGTGQLRPENVVSLTFADLAELLETEQAAETNTEGVRLATPTPTPAATLVVPQPTPADTPPAEDAEVTDEVLPELDKNAKTNLLIEEADWVLFAMLDVDPTRYPSSAVVKDFLRLRGNQLATKHIVVLGLHAPYFLDATEISKLNAYYGVYSKTQPFLESAVRALFRAFAPIGAPPVSVPGTRFGSLAERLAPDAARGIELQVTTPEGEVVAGAAVETAPAQPMVEVGQLVRVQAGPILDHNGHPVRDGTIVEMRFTYTDDPANSETESAPTQNGVALRDVMLSRAGTVQVEAQTGDAVTAQAVALSVQAAPGAEPAAALTTTIAATTALTGTTPLTVAAEPVVTAPGDPLPGQRINLVSLIVALFTIVATTLLLLIVQVRVLPRATLVHSILWAVNCGLLGYILYGLGLVPGGAWLQSSLRVWGAGLVVFVAMLLPLVWLQLRTE
jgi:beta-N-acetylhexosaminidase